jgi:hypothetical protein
MRFRALALAGVLAGTLDGLAAVLYGFIITGRIRLRVFKYIASAALGPSAVEGGAGATAAGVLFHYTIAFGWATAYFLAHPRIRRVLPNPIVSGLLYGVVVWLGMNLVVVPLSRLPAQTMTVRGVAIGVAILMVCVGLPIAIIADRSSPG